MFNSIARRYDLVNHVLSAGVDRRWRRRARREVAALLPGRELRILDVCCGTGDLSREMAALGTVTGVDFAREMLEIARRKLSQRSASYPVHYLEGDGLQLPFRKDSFDAVAAAFGVRNFENLALGLQEMTRVLKPGGVLAILEFSRPRLPVFATLYGFYFRRILPLLGGMLAGRMEPYRYLPASVGSFLDPAEMCRLLRESGTRTARILSLTGGIASLYLSRKESVP